MQTDILNGKKALVKYNRMNTIRQLTMVLTASVQDAKYLPNATNTMIKYASEANWHM
jgi:hypothetical protein